MISVVWAGSQDAKLRDLLSKWCAEQIWPGMGREFPESACMGVFDDGTLIAVMAFHDWDPVAGVIEFSGAATSRKWITRNSLHQMFAYPFETAGAQLLVTRNSADDRQKHLHRMLKSYGMVPQRVRRLFGPTEDAFLWTMTKEEWQESKFNKGRKNEQA